MKNFFYCLLFLLVTKFLFVSCTSNLSRSSAQKIIFENLPTSLQTISVQFGRNPNGEIVGPKRRRNYDGYTEASATAELQIIDKLIENGLIIKDKYEYRWSEKIQPYVTTNGDFFYNIPVANAIGVEVTGIADIDDSMKLVECFIVYEWNEVGKMANLSYTLKIPHEFEFRKYDDGWRLDLKNKPCP